MQRIVLPVKAGKLIIYAKRLADEDNDTGDRSRWAQLVAYKGFGVNEENAETYNREYYLLYAIGHSLVVHAADGCKGRLAPVAMFGELNEDADDLEACPDCEPDFSEDTPPDVQLKIEVTRYSHTQYTSATALIDSLRKCQACSHRPHEGKTCGCKCPVYVKGELSQIGQRLLAKLRVLDEGIAEALPAEICL